MRRRRIESGLSLAAFARKVHYHKSYLSKIENGLKRPSPDLAEHCDAVLGAGGALAALAPTPHHPVYDGHNRAAPGRRATLARYEHVEYGPAGPWWPVTPTTAPKRPSGQTLAWFGSTLGELRKLGQTTAPAVVLPIVAGGTQALQALAAESPAGMRDRALVLAARYAEYAGWMAQETGNDALSRWWTDRAVDLATHGGDSELAAFGLIRRALSALYRHDADTTVALARRAQSARCRPRIGGLAAVREAQGHAIAGDEYACRQALDRAADHLLRDAGDNGMPTLGTSSVDDPVAMVTGWCLYDLGRPAEAAEILERELARLPAWAHRAQARFAARYALALVDIGEAEQACAVAEGVLDGLAQVDSATIRVDLTLLTRHLARWRTVAAVDHIRPRLTAALRTAERTT